MKTRSLKIASVLVALSCMLALASCAQTQQSEDAEKKVSEGVDTKIEVTGYSNYSGPSSSVFLAEGDSVAVIAPSSLPSDEQTDATIEGLKKWGYTPVEGKHVRDKERTLQDCVDDLEWALDDPTTKAIFCVRGGYGASEVMDALPKDRIASSKKLLIGYSDITVYHSAWASAGIPSMHASMSAAFMDLPEECAEIEQRLMKGEVPAYRCEGGEYNVKGSAQGTLIGGNLSTFTSVLDTAYDCAQKGEPYILFLEDVEEDLQHVHRYLTILKHTGVLDGAAGIVFGEWTDMPETCDDYSGDSRGGAFTSVADMISRQLLPNADIPVAYGFPAGHGDVNYPLLMGEKVKLTVSEDDFTLEWA